MQFLKKFLNLSYYTSELDNFLVEFDHRHPTLSDSQRQEIKKYQRIYLLRDNPNPPAEQEEWWDKF